jgi:hypothetical protein
MTVKTYFVPVMGLGAPHSSGDTSRGTKGRVAYCCAECFFASHPRESVYDTAEVSSDEMCDRCGHAIGERFIVTINKTENPIIEVLSLRIVFGIGLPEAHTMHKVGYVGDRSSAFEMEYGRALANADKLNAEFAKRAESDPPFRARKASER